MGVVAAAASIIGTGVSAYSSYKKAKAQKQANMRNAEIAEENAISYEKQAAYLEEDAQYYSGLALDALETGKKEVRTLKQNINLIEGGQRATYGSSGIEVTSGSAMQVVLDTAKFGNVDAMTLEKTYADKAEAYNRQATATRREAQQYIDLASQYKNNAVELRNMKTYTLLNTAGTLASGIADTAKTIDNL